MDIVIETDPQFRRGHRQGHKGVPSRGALASAQPKAHIPLAGSVANFAQEVLKGQPPPSVRGLSSQGVEQFGRSETLVSCLDQPLPFLNHVHEFDTN